MRVSLPAVFNHAHRLHEPGGEIWVGVRTPGTELPERAERIRSALLGAGARGVEAEAHGDEAVDAVHERALLDYLAGAWEGWERAGLTEDPGQDRVVPYIVCHPGMTDGFAPTRPAAASARAGFFAYDTMTLIGPGTWQAARGAIDTALTAVGLVAAGEPLAYACCRPPGHHAAAACFGGSCYLNNAAAAAVALRARVGAPVAVLDIDAHHGNGTQQIFYEDPTVLTGSVHVDPGGGWFPHFLGFERETGAGPAAGTNRNLCLDPGAGDDEWLAAVIDLAGFARAGGAVGLVVPLGVDPAGGDPEAPRDVSADGFHRAGRALGELGLPTVVVQEGGYDLATIGELVTAPLAGFEAGLDDAQP